MEETHRSKEFPMRRIILAAIVATIGSSEGARAQCVDTLTMKSLWLYHQSVVDSKAKGAWDSTVLSNSSRDLEKRRTGKLCPLRRHL